MGSRWFYSLIASSQSSRNHQETREMVTPPLQMNIWLLSIFLRPWNPPKRHFISIDDDRPRRRDHPVADWWPGWLIVEYVWNVRKHVSSSCRLFRSLTKHRRKVLNPKDLSVNLWPRINTSWHISQIVKTESEKYFCQRVLVIARMAESAYLQCFAECSAEEPVYHTIYATLYH